ncbi:MAG: hypothetical protein HOO86_01025 [Bacteroidales bacterium]|nr:hypothetical protein [Bacteroidales bacterium]
MDTNNNLSKPTDKNDKDFEEKNENVQVNNEKLVKKLEIQRKILKSIIDQKSTFKPDN